MNVKQLIHEYMSSTRFTKLSDSSKTQYWSAMSALEKRFGERDVTDLRRAEFVKLHDEMGKAPAMANRFIRVSSLLFNFAIDRDYIQTNPAQRIRKHGIKEWSRWEMEEVNRVIELNDPIVSPAVALAFFTGQRESDILNMKWSDIVDGSITVIQSKTKHYLQIKMAPELIEILSRFPQRGSHIVGGNVHVSGASFRGMFKRATRKLGIDRQFHGIRKTVGAVLAERGRSTNEIAALLGHKTLDMAAKYTRQANETKMISSAVDALG